MANENIKTRVLEKHGQYIVQVWHNEEIGWTDRTAINFSTGLPTDQDNAKNCAIECAQVIQRTEQTDIIVWSSENE